MNSPATGVVLRLAEDRRVANPRLQDGDRLLKVNRRAVNRLHDVSQILDVSDGRPPRPLDVLLSRHGELVFLNVSRDEMSEVLETASQNGYGAAALDEVPTASLGAL